MDFSSDKTNVYNGIYIGRIENNGYDENSTRSNVGDDGKVITDPSNRNRVQIRVLGIHSENNKEDMGNGIETKNLPWAEQAAGLLGGGQSEGEGTWTVPNNGSMVYCFFLNGNVMKPIFFAAVIGGSDVQSSQVNRGEHFIVTKKGTRFKIVERINPQTNKEESSVEMKLHTGATVKIKVDNTDPTKANIDIATNGIVAISAESIVVGRDGAFKYPLLAPSPDTLYDTGDGRKVRSSKITRLG